MLSSLALCIASIHDGDSIRTCDGQRIRLVAASGPMDTPEVHCTARDRRNPNRDCNIAAGIAARNALRSILARGQAVADCDGRDRYGRSLCRVRVNGRDVGDMMIAGGWARVVEGWR